jgi:hypothetical protein
VKIKVSIFDNIEAATNFDTHNFINELKVCVGGNNAKISIEENLETEGFEICQLDGCCESNHFHQGTGACSNNQVAVFGVGTKGNVNGCAYINTNRGSDVQVASIVRINSNANRSDIEGVTYRAAKTQVAGCIENNTSVNGEAFNGGQANGETEVELITSEVIIISDNNGYVDHVSIVYQGNLATGEGVRIEIGYSLDQPSGDSHVITIINEIRCASEIKIIAGVGDVEVQSRSHQVDSSKYFDAVII